MRGWPEEVIAWLRENVPGRTTKQVTELINQQGFDKKYGMVFSDAAIKGAKNRYGIKSGTTGGVPKGYSLKYPKGMESYIRSIAVGRKTKEIAELVSVHFGIEFRATMFKKGDVPANHMEVGEYTHTTDGYLIRKVKEIGQQWERFEFVHRAVWEEHNGPVPEGKMVSFLDGNKDNCNIENLVLIDNEENLEMNRSQLRFTDPERTKTGTLVAKARVTVRQKKRRK